jgi:hypothetical protein
LRCYTKGKNKKREVGEWSVNCEPSLARGEERGAGQAVAFLRFVSKFHLKKYFLL